MMLWPLYIEQTPTLINLRISFPFDRHLHQRNGRSLFWMYLDAQRCVSCHTRKLLQTIHVVRLRAFAFCEYHNCTKL